MMQFLGTVLGIAVAILLFYNWELVDAAFVKFMGGI